jgi:hypothetical protein
VFELFDFDFQPISLNPELVGDSGGDSSCPEACSEPEVFCEEVEELQLPAFFGGVGGAEGSVGVWAGVVTLVFS